MEKLFGFYGDFVEFTDVSQLQLHIDGKPPYKVELWSIDEKELIDVNEYSRSTRFKNK